MASSGARTLPSSSTVRQAATKRRVLYDELKFIQRRVAAADQEYADVTIAYSRRRTSAIACMIQDRLPLELRHCVYRHYWDVKAPEYGAAMRPYESCYTYHVFSRDSLKSVREQKVWTELPTLMRVDFVGEQTAREATLALLQQQQRPSYVRVNPLRFYGPLQTLREYLTLDVYSLRITPAHFLRFIGLAFHLEDVEKTAAGALSLDYTKEIEQKSVALLDIHNQSGLELGVDIWPYTPISLTVQFLDAFEAVYRKLKKNGAKIGIAIQPDNYDFYWGINVEDYYDMPFHQWHEQVEQKISKNLAILAEPVDIDEEDLNAI